VIVVIVAAARFVATPAPPERLLPIEAELVTAARPQRARASTPDTLTDAPSKAQFKPEAKPEAKPAPKPAPKLVVQPVPDTPAPVKTPPKPAPTLKPLPRVLSTAHTAEPVASKPAAALTAPPPTSPPDADKLKREAELRARMAAEEHADALRASGALNTWTQNIRGKVERAWLRPPSVTSALDCVVRVTQVPGGEVVRVELQTCNGDASARESIEAAVYRASPLPQPADAALFERVIEFRFHPSE
jgi:colicin import membrane protein